MPSTVYLNIIDATDTISRLANRAEHYAVI